VAITVAVFTSDDPTILHQIVHPSGEFSARFLIDTMMASALALLLRCWRGPLERSLCDYPVNRLAGHAKLLRDNFLMRAHPQKAIMLVGLVGNAFLDQLCELCCRTL